MSRSTNATRVIRPVALTLGMFVALALSAPASADGLDDVRDGNNAFKRGQYEQAVESFTRAVIAGDLDVEAMAITLNNRGVAYGELGDFDRAMEDYEAALELSPDDPKTLKNMRVTLVRRGFSHLNLGELGQARADYERAIDIAPDHYLAYMRRGELAIEEERYDEAIADLELAETLEPGERAVGDLLLEARRRQQEEAVLPVSVAQSQRATSEAEATRAAPTGNAVSTAVNRSPALAPSSPEESNLASTREAPLSTPRDAPLSAVRSNNEAATAAENSTQATTATSQPSSAPVASATPSVSTTSPRPAATASPTPATRTSPPPAAATSPSPTASVTSSTSIAPARAEPAPAPTSSASASVSPSVDSSTPEPPATEPSVSELTENTATPEEQTDNQVAAAHQDWGLPIARVRSTNPVNFRAGPGNDFERLGSVNADVILPSFGIELGWYQIEAPNGQRGYIFRRYIEEIE